MKMMQNARRFTFALAMLTLGLAGCDDDNGGSTDPEPEAPPAPIALGGNSTEISIGLTWSSVSGADSYIVERQTVGGSNTWSVLGEGLTETSYTDESVQVGVTYLYRVRATNDAGDSAPSETLQMTTQFDVLQGEIDDELTLDPDVTYLLRGIVAVNDGGVLRIPAGTLILGDVDVTPTALIVRQGGRLYSEGTAADPVVFTSSNLAGERDRGDWGGIVLNGYSNCNFEGDCIGEGNSGPFGGDDPDDDSGRITYTRIEFVGYEVSYGSELNALTLNGVGSGTELHHIQTHYGLDDGFEWFGGTVDLKYALTTGASDDSFDYSTGWQGRGQFWVAQQDPDDADHGFEVDGQEFVFDAEPLTTPTIYNVSLIGGGEAAGNDDTRGILYRRGAGGELRNIIVLGMNDFGLDVDNQETLDLFTGGMFSLDNSIIFDTNTNLVADEDNFAATVWNGGATNRVEDPGLADPYNRESPDFRPTAGSNALTGFAAPPADGWFDGVDFVGGVDPDDEWYAGWTTSAEN